MPPPAKSRTKKPDWFHQKGYEMMAGDVDGEGKLIIFGNSTPGGIEIRTSDGEEFLLQWEICIPKIGGMRQGRQWLTRDQMVRAFCTAGVANVSSEGGIPLPEHEVFLKRYQADCGLVGIFIRRGDFLNLPCPGTGDMGDPNISIFLSSELRKKVEMFLFRECKQLALPKKC